MIGKMRLIDANALVTQIDLQRKASKASYPKQSFALVMSLIAYAMLLPWAPLKHSGFL